MSPQSILHHSDTSAHRPTRARIRGFAPMIFGLTLAAIPVFAATAQETTPADPNASALQQTVEDLNAQLTAARAALAEMRIELEKLRAENAALRTERDNAMAGTDSESGDTGVITEDDAPPAPPEIVTIDETKPGASPRALLRAMSLRYEQDLGGLDRGDDTRSPARANYTRELQRWIRSIEREVRLPIEWHVRITGRAEIPGGGVMMQAVDPVSDAKLGDPFPARVSSAIMGRLRLMEQRDLLEDPVILKGLISPDLVFNAQRLDAGAIDRPRFVGPFTEFGFDVIVRSVLPLPDAAARAEARRNRELEEEQRALGGDDSGA